MLIELIGIILGNTSLVLFMYLSSHKNEQFKYKEFLTGIIVYNAFSIILSEIDSLIPRISLMLLSLLFINIFVFSEKLFTSFYKIILVSFLLITYEVLFFQIFSLLNNFSEIQDTVLMSLKISNNTFFSFLYNICFILYIAIMSRLKLIYIIYDKLFILYNRLNKIKVIITFVMIFSMVILGYIVINTTEKIMMTFFIFGSLLVVIAYVLIKDLNIRSEYEEVKEKYSNTRQSLLEYEDMIDKYRVNNHENKNQLLTIQSMINNKECKVNKYIDELVGNVYMTNEKIMFDVSIIPAGGLRATIHSKLNTMDNKKIKYVLNIDRKLRSIDFDNIDSELNLKICKIVSIFIDNSIEEVETHESEKIVNIEMYLNDNNLAIEVSNRFENEFDIEKIYHKKYTTKSNGHGYGLALAKELIDSEKTLKNINMIEDNIFTQVLEIQIKK